MTLLGRIEAVKSLYESLDPLFGQHRDHLREDQYYQLAELESEILNTISYDRLIEFVGGADVIKMLSVSEQEIPRMQLALADNNMDVITSNGRTVREVLEAMKLVVA